MNLLLDIGNSRVKWALAEHGTLGQGGAIQRDATPNWTEALPRADVQTVYVASVVHDSAMEGLAMYARAHGMGLQRVRSAARSERLVNAYREPERLGVDRWLACIAAEARGPGSVLVADAGTALTLDWIGDDGRHGGGLITAGVASTRSALRASTQLSPRRTPDAGGWLATDTDSAIAGGTLRGATALLDAAARDMAPDRLLITGGEARLIASYLTRSWTLAPQLVLEGLAIHVARSTTGSQIAAQASE